MSVVMYRKVDVDGINVFYREGDPRLPCTLKRTKWESAGEKAKTPGASHSQVTIRNAPFKESNGNVMVTVTLAGRANRYFLKPNRESSSSPAANVGLSLKRGFLAGEPSEPSQFRYV
jgi:hypothetical protein